jgi:guanylate kinase
MQPTQPVITCENGKRGLLVVISGPSGVGKTTIARRLEQHALGEFSVSATTRPKTAADLEGHDYHFLTEEDFRARVDRGEMLEFAQVFGKHWYGTPREPVERALREGRLIILEIDVQGGLQVRKRYPRPGGGMPTALRGHGSDAAQPAPSPAFMIFIEPPSEQALLDRLRLRGRDSEEAIQRRFSEAKREIAMAHSSGAYDLFVMNDDLDDAIDEVCRAVEERRCGT